MRQELISAIKANQPAFGLDLSAETIERLADFHDLVHQHNSILHLVGPTTPEEFATRHILESLTMLRFLGDGARFADVGAGAGLPSIPCLIARPDLSAILIESKEKKTKYLEETLKTLGLEDRAEVINRQFAEVDATGFSYVACRALDKFSDTVPRLLRWAKKQRLLFFGGDRLREALHQQKLNFDEVLMPLSEKRYLFVSTN